MQNALAVYTSKPSLSGRKLLETAQKDGLPLRYLALGVYIPGDMLAMQNAALTAVSGGARLVVGAVDSQAGSLAEFDRLIALSDRKPIVEMLTADKLPWCELYTQRFNYESWVKRSPKDKAKIDGSVPANQLPALKGAKTRYIIFNQGKKKSGRQLMTRLTELIAGATGGIVSDHQQPSR